MATRTRGWCLTVNNPPEGYVEHFRAFSEAMDYCIVGREVAPTTGTVHLQCYVHWVNPKSMARMRSLFAGAHLSVALGTPQQNKVYCSKEEVITLRLTTLLSPGVLVRERTYNLSRIPSRSLGTCCPRRSLE